MSEKINSSQDFTIAFPAARLTNHGTTDSVMAHGSCFNAVPNKHFKYLKYFKYFKFTLQSSKLIFNKTMTYTHTSLISTLYSCPVWWQGLPTLPKQYHEPEEL